MSFQSEVLPRKTASNNSTKEITDRDKVIDSSVACLIDKVLTAGIARKISDVIRIP